MSRSRGINTYPEAFWSVVEKAATSDECFEFPVADWRAGMSLQGKFYAFRGALAREAMRLALVQPKSSPERARVEAALAYSQQVVCWLNKNDPAPIVRIMHRNHTPEAKMFEEALVRAGQKTPEQEIAESAQRVLGKVNKDEGKYG